MSNYQKIRKTIVAKIEDGVYRPGEPINSLRELAKSTGSSVGTVGRAITHLVSEGYLYAGKGRRFYVDEKKSRASNKFQTVGLLSTSVPNLQHPGEGSLFQDAIVAVQGGLDQVGMATLIVPASRWFQALGKYEFVDVEELASRGLQGLLVLGIYSLSYLRKLRARIPVLVAMDIDASDEGIDCAAFDNRRSAIEKPSSLSEILYGMTHAFSYLT